MIAIRTNSPLCSLLDADKVFSPLARCAVGSRFSRESRRKRNYSQLTTFGDENGAPSPFPSDGTSKTASRVLSNSSLTVHKDGAYMQVRNARS